MYELIGVKEESWCASSSRTSVNLTPFNCKSMNGHSVFFSQCFYISVFTGNVFLSLKYLLDKAHVCPSYRNQYKVMSYNGYPARPCWWISFIMLVHQLNQHQTSKPQHGNAAALGWLFQQGSVAEVQWILSSSVLNFSSGSLGMTGNAVASCAVRLYIMSCTCDRWQS